MSISLDEDDLAFFRRAMKDVRRTSFSIHPINAKQRSLFRIKKLTFIREKENDAIDTLLTMLSDPLDQTVGAEDKLFFSRSELQKKQLKSFIFGKIRQSVCLDLHGMTVEQARLAIVHCLLHSRAAGYRCVKIIHGKGQPGCPGAKLKNYVNDWLRQISWVLAFTSAQPRDGGTGAMYVLLQRLRGSLYTHCA